MQGVVQAVLGGCASLPGSFVPRRILGGCPMQYNDFPCFPCALVEWGGGGVVPVVQGVVLVILWLVELSVEHSR